MIILNEVFVLAFRIVSNFIRMTAESTLLVILNLTSCIGLKIGLALDRLSCKLQMNMGGGFQGCYFTQEYPHPILLLLTLSPFLFHLTFNQLPSLQVLILNIPPFPLYFDNLRFTLMWLCLFLSSIHKRHSTLFIINIVCGNQISENRFCQTMNLSCNLCSVRW